MADSAYFLAVVALFSCFAVIAPMHGRDRYGYNDRRASHGRGRQSYEHRDSYRPQRTYYKAPPKKTYQTYDPRALTHYDPPRRQSYRPVTRYAKETPIHYEQPKHSTGYKKDQYDPCSNKHEGDYSLGGEFKSTFPYVDSRCYFIKCANYKAFLNPCGIGTRNDEYGEGYCSHLDYEGHCGLAFGAYHKKQDKGYRDHH